MAQNKGCNLLITGHRFLFTGTSLLICSVRGLNICGTPPWYHLPGLSSNGSCEIFLPPTPSPACPSDGVIRAPSIRMEAVVDRVPLRGDSLKYNIQRAKAFATEVSSDQVSIEEI